MFPYQRIKVWVRANALATDILRLTRGAVDRRTDIVLVQLWRAASSIGANIAEGAAHDSHAQFARYLTIALGSANETESHLILATEAGLIESAAGKRMLREIAEVKSMLWAFRQRVQTDPRRKRRPPD